MVEFAIVAPVLVLILFGIIEFGLLFGQQLDVRHGAREAGRLAAVNYQATDGSSGNTQSLEIVAETCNRMELAEASTVSLDLPEGVAIGDIVRVLVRAPAEPVTGFFDPMLNDTVLSSEVDIRLEQVASFAVVTDQACP